MEHMVFLNGVSYLLFPVCKLPEAFSVMASKSWYFHYFNTEENLNNIGSIPDVLLWREWDGWGGEDRVSRVVRDSGAVV